MSASSIESTFEKTTRAVAPKLKPRTGRESIALGEVATDLGRIAETKVPAIHTALRCSRRRINEKSRASSARSRDFYQTRRPRSLLPWPYATFHGFRTHQAPAPRAVIMHCS
jgi:hypothetical protein